MKKYNCIILHGCPSVARHPHLEEEKHWIPWLKIRLEEKGLSVDTPALPEPWRPKYESFKKKLEEYTIDENTILIGHSCGTTLITRYLGETKKKVHGIFLVAPWKYDDDKRDQEYYGFDIDYSLSSQVEHITYFTSEDEDRLGRKSLDLYVSKFGGKVIELPQHGHYTLGDMGTEEFPELLDEILNIL